MILESLQLVYLEKLQLPFSSLHVTVGSGTQGFLSLANTRYMFDSSLQNIPTVQFDPKPIQSY